MKGSYLKRVGKKCTKHIKQKKVQNIKWICINKKMRSWQLFHALYSVFLFYSDIYKNIYGSLIQKYLCIFNTKISMDPWYKNIYVSLIQKYLWIIDTKNLCILDTKISLDTWYKNIYVSLIQKYQWILYKKISMYPWYKNIYGSLIQKYLCILVNHNTMRSPHRI